MSQPRAIIEEQAIAWLIRTRDPRFAEWESFMLWLEEDPLHAELYDEVAATDADLDALAAPAPRPLIAPQPERPRVSRRFAMGGGAIAAALAVVLGYTALAPGASTYDIETAPGARRSLALADGSRIDLNGGTKLTLDRENPRFAALERGEALFTVIHDDKRPFIVETGGATLTDAGTAFNVVRTDRMTEVAVSEGVVIYGKGDERVTLPAGRALRAVDGRRAIAGDADAQAIGGWRHGRLIYGDADFTTLAGDLSRNLGIPVAVSPGLAHRRFSGVILLEGGADRAVPRAGAVLGVSARPSGNGWILTDGGDAER